MWSSSSVAVGFPADRTEFGVVCFPFSWRMADSGRHYKTLDDEEGERWRAVPPKMRNFQNFIPANLLLRKYKERPLGKLCLRFRYIMA